jgi:hypothetical protein
MTDLYAPNQQVVRADGSGPAEEGRGAGKRRGRPPKSDADKQAAANGNEEEAKEEAKK